MERIRGMVTLLVVTGVFGFVFGTVYSVGAHEACAVTAGTPDIYQGDDHRNICNGNDDYDSFWGYMYSDDLGGDGGRDDIRGNHGNDYLHDTSPTDDSDRTCDGNGSDNIDVYDGDLRDEVHLLIGDGETDTWKDDCASCSKFDYSSKCPF